MQEFPVELTDEEIDLLGTENPEEVAAMLVEVHIGESVMAAILPPQHLPGKECQS